MVDKQNAKLLKIAAVLFFGCFLAFNLGNTIFYKILFSIQNKWMAEPADAANIKAYLACLAFVLVPIGLLAQKKGIITAGCVLSVLFWALYLLGSGRNVFRFANPVNFYETNSNFKLIWLCDFFFYFVPVIWIILAAVGCNCKRGAAAALLFICAVLMALAAFFHMGSHSMLLALDNRIPRMIPRYINDCKRLFILPSISSWSSLGPYVFPAIGSVLGAIGCVLCGIAFKSSNLPDKLPNTPHPVQSNTISKVDRIVTLKALLDQGVISQEDFERKKQEIIGQ